MENTAEGETLLAKRRAAEDALRSLDSRLYDRVEHWCDKELYGGLFGHSGAELLPIQHLPAIKDLLRARAAVYRGRKSGAITHDRGSTAYDSEVGNEQMAQTIDACLEALGEGPIVPPGKAWHEFLPDWS